jgi:hypothetical protein
MLAQRYSLFMVIYLLVQGIQGLFGNTAFWVFGTNAAHGGTEIAVALVGLLWGMRGPQKSLYLILVGIIFMVIGAMRFIPGADDFIVRLYNTNTTLAVFNLIVGAVTIGIGINDRRGTLAPAGRPMGEEQRQPAGMGR